MNLNYLRLQSVESYRNANVFLCFLRQISMAGVPEFSILRRNLQWGTIHYSGISPDAGLLTWLMRSMFSLLYTLRLIELVTSRTVTDLGHQSGLGNGQAPVWCQAITWTKYYLFVNWTVIYNEIQTTIQIICIGNGHRKMSAIVSWLQCVNQTIRSRTVIRCLPVMWCHRRLSEIFCISTPFASSY